MVMCRRGSMTYASGTRPYEGRADFRYACARCYERTCYFRCRFLCVRKEYTLVRKVRNFLLTDGLSTKVSESGTLYLWYLNFSLFSCLSRVCQCVQFTVRKLFNISLLLGCRNENQLTKEVSNIAVLENTLFDVKLC